MNEFLNIYLFHWTADRAIWLGGHTLWWDARCAGIYTGFGLGALYQLRAARDTGKLPSARDFLIGALFAIPLFLDVLTVSYGLRAPSNDARYLTGLLFGGAFSIYLVPAFMVLVRRRQDRQGTGGHRKHLAAPLAMSPAAFLLKGWDSIIAYGVLQVLAVFGFLTLLAILAVGTFKVAANPGRPPARSTEC